MIHLDCFDDENNIPNVVIEHFMIMIKNVVKSEHEFEKQIEMNVCCAALKKQKPYQATKIIVLMIYQVVIERCICHMIEQVSVVYEWWLRTWNMIDFKHV